MIKKKPFFDKIIWGLAFGLILPILIFFIYYLLKFGDVPFSLYIQNLHTYGLLFKIMSLCVLSDLPLFYLFLQLKYMTGSKGIVMACFIYGFAVLAYRFI